MNTERSSPLISIQSNDTYLSDNTKNLTDLSGSSSRKAKPTPRKCESSRCHKKCNLKPMDAECDSFVTIPIDDFSKPKCKLHKIDDFSKPKCKLHNIDDFSKPVQAT